MKELNPKLFKGIYEIYNIDTDTIEDIVVADSEYNALPNGNEYESACDFFEDKRTIKDLREELKEGCLSLEQTLKSIEELFYDFFDKEDYQIKRVHNSKESEQYIVIDNVQGAELIFDVNYTRYNIYHVYASGIFFAVRYSTDKWLRFLEATKEISELIFAYNHPELDNDSYWETDNDE